MGPKHIYKKIVIIVLVMIFCGNLDAKMVFASNEISRNQLFVTRVILRGGTEALDSIAQKAVENVLLNKFTSLEELQQAAEMISSIYRENGYFLAKAYLPAQQSNDGSITFIVLEGCYGQIKFHNESWLSEEKIRTLTERLKPGMVIRRDELERQLLLLADVPGLQVQSVLQPGEKVGTADLIISLREGQRMSVSTQVDNYGDLSTGAWRSGLNIAMNHPFGGDESLEVGGIRFGGMRTATNHFRYSEGIGKNGVRATLSYDEKKYRLDGEYSVLDIHGASNIWDLTLQYPIRRTQKNNLYAGFGVSRRKIQEWFLGMQDDKWSESMHGAIYGDGHDDVGNAVDYSLVYQNGILMNDSEEHNRFEKWNFAANRRQMLSPLTYVTFSLNGQWAPRPLDSSEKISIGGPLGIRAYAQGSGVGDDAWQLTTELHYKMSRTMEAILFADAGSVMNNLEKWRNMYGSGLGVEWGMEKWRARMDYSWKMGHFDQDADFAAGHWWLRIAHLF